VPETRFETELSQLVGTTPTLPRAQSTQPWTAVECMFATLLVAVIDRDHD
jgi:hypothetical protein